METWKPAKDWWPVRLLRQERRRARAQGHPPTFTGSDHGDRERPRVHPDVRDDQAHAAAEQVPRALASVGERCFRPVGLGGFHEAIHDAGRRGFSTRSRPPRSERRPGSKPNAARSEPGDRSRAHPRGRAGGSRCLDHGLQGHCRQPRLHDGGRVHDPKGISSIPATRGNVRAPCTMPTFRPRRSGR